MGSYPRKGVEALLELALSCVEMDQDHRPQMIEVTRDLEIIMRDTVAPESPSFWNRGDSSTGSSFNKGSETWPSAKKLSPSSLGNVNATDVSWVSTDELMDSHSRDVTIEMEPR